MLLPAVQARAGSGPPFPVCEQSKQLGLACINYTDGAKVFPVSQWFTASGTLLNGMGHWPRVLPFIEEQALYDRINFKHYITCSQSRSLRQRRSP